MIAKNHSLILEQREDIIRAFREKREKMEILNLAITKNDIDINFDNKELPDGIPRLLEIARRDLVFRYLEVARWDLVFHVG